jgi:hypothetical protein
MEAYWRKVRGELEFELVNTSRVQLDMSLCAGRKVCASAENYLSEKGPFDLVVVAYVLGHVNPVATLLGTLKNMVKGSRLIVYDVFSGSERFNAAMHYESPRLQDVRWFGFEHDLLLRCMYTGGIPMCALMKELVPWVEKEVTPALFIFEK